MSGSAPIFLKTSLRAALVGWGYTYGYVDGSSLAFIIVTDIIRLSARSDEIAENCTTFVKFVVWSLVILPMNLLAYLGVRNFSFYFVIYYGLYFYMPKGRTERTDMYVSIILSLTAVIAWTLDYINLYTMVFTCCTDLVEIAQSFHVPGLSLALIENQHSSPVIIVLMALLPAMCWLVGIDTVYLWVLVGASLVFLAARANLVGWKVGQRRYGAQEANSREFYNALLEHWWNFSKLNLVDFLKKSLSGQMEVVSFTSRSAPSLYISSIRVQQLSSTEVAVRAFISFKVEDFHLVARKFLSEYTFKDVTLKGNIQIILSYSLWTSFPHISHVKIRFTNISQFDLSPQATGFQYLFNPIAELFIQQYITDVLQTGFDIPIGQPRMSQDPCRVS